MARLSAAPHLLQQRLKGLQRPAAGIGDDVALAQIGAGREFPQPLLQRGILARQQKGRPLQGEDLEQVGDFLQIEILLAAGEKGGERVTVLEGKVGKAESQQIGHRLQNLRIAHDDHPVLRLEYGIAAGHQDVAFSVDDADAPAFRVEGREGLVGQARIQMHLDFEDLVLAEADPLHRFRFLFQAVAQAGGGAGEDALDLHPQPLHRLHPFLRDPDGDHPADVEVLLEDPRHLDIDLLVGGGDDDGVVAADTGFFEHQSAGGVAANRLQLLPAHLPGGGQRFGTGIDADQADIPGEAAHQLLADIAHSDDKKLAGSHSMLQQEGIGKRRTAGFAQV